MRIELLSFDEVEPDPMELNHFMQSLDQKYPPEVGAMLKALWFDHNGDWHRAHNIVQEMGDAMASRIHAYLHWKEGDLGNAGYWYSRAGVDRPTHDLESEWKQLVTELTGK